MRKTDVEHFLKLAGTYPVIDVRSPLEFEAGHIPGAVNIPLFDNDERAVVGTIYKKEGRMPAIVEGIRRTGPTMFRKLEEALKHAAEGKLLVHCWRGGMRSEAMAWLFSLGDMESLVLEGGYKAYRHNVMEGLARERKMIILGGMTGSSKTHILRYLRSRGLQVIDLEGIANHKGSAFGALGQPPQPSSEQFSNVLFHELSRLDYNQPVWLEDESRNIGTVFMPELFYLNMQKAPTIVLKMSIETRLPRLIEEYSAYPPELLKASVVKISRRLGGDNTRDALKAIDSDISEAIRISLRYYDKTYLYSLKRKNNDNIVYVETDTNDIEVNAAKVMEAASMLR